MQEFEQFEYILLKKLVLNGEFFGKVMPILKKKYFMNIGNQELFGLIKEYYGKYKNRPELTELVAQVKNVSNADIRNEIIKALQVISKTDEVSSIQFLCDETITWVKDSLYLEALQVGSDGLMRKDDKLKLKAQELMDERAKVSIDADLGLDFDDIETMIEYYSARMLGIRTQHKELNKRLGPGFLPGTLNIILAAQGVGKSLLMTDLISGIFKQNKNILLVSLEMADKEIMKRVHANAMDLPINSLIDLSKTPGEISQLDRPVLTKEMILAAYERIKTSGTCGKFYVKDYPAGSFSPLMLEQLIETYRIEQNVVFDLVFVDYIGIMKSDLVSPSAGLYSYVKSIGEEVRAVAKKQNIPIISASQLNRGATNNIDNADNSNVSDSMGTAMTADFMMFLLQNEEMKAKKEIVCKITKNRYNGRTDTWIMGIDYDHMRFNEVLVQPGQIDQELEIGVYKPSGRKKNISDDFGLTELNKQKNAENFADREIKNIIKDDFKKLKEIDSEFKTQNPFENDIEKLYKELGI